MDHWDGTTIQEVYGGNFGQSIRAISPTDVWVSGSPPIHWNGTSWTPLGGTDETITKIWADPAPNDVWMLSGLAIHHYDGTTLAPVFTTSLSLLGLDGNDSELWVVGQGGATLRMMLPSTLQTQ